MPITQIYLMEGRSDDQKKTVIEKVTRALQEALDVPAQNIRVLIVDVPKASWGIGGVPASELGR